MEIDPYHILTVCNHSWYNCTYYVTDYTKNCDWFAIEPCRLVCMDQSVAYPLYIPHLISVNHNQSTRFMTTFYLCTIIEKSSDPFSFGGKPI